MNFLNSYYKFFSESSFFALPAGEFAIKTKGIIEKKKIILIYHKFAVADDAFVVAAVAVAADDAVVVAVAVVAVVVFDFVGASGHVDVHYCDSSMTKTRLSVAASMMLSAIGHELFVSSVQHY